MSLLLELNDVELSLWRGLERLYAQPAAALVEDDRVVFGHEALKAARLRPQRANQQYLARLNSDPLPHPTRRCANHADLVYLHLLELKPLIDGALTISVPGMLGPEQLGVLLGIADEAGIDVNGFVDTAVLLATSLEGLEASHLLDLHLGRGGLTELGVEDGKLHRLTTRELPGCGVSSCVDGWVNLIADRFVQQTRFDPLHAARSEQQLYDQVYAWTAGHDNGEFEVAVDMTDHVRRVAVGRAAIEEKLAQRLRPVGSHVPAGSTLLLSPRSARLPGMAAALATMGLRARAVADDALARSFVAHASLIERKGEPRLVTRLPFQGEPAALPPAPAAGPSATHVLLGDRAWPLAGNPFGLPERGAVGQRLDRDGVSYRLIRVEG